MICPLCGKDAGNGPLCSECYLKKNLKIELPNKIEVEHCRTCGKYLLGGRWKGNIDEEKIVKNLVLESLKSNISGLEKTGLQKIDIQKRGTEYIVSVIVEAGDFKKEEKGLVRIKVVSCQECSRKAGGYYEAVLQLRGGISKKVLEDIVKFVESSKDKNSFVKEITKITGGYDVYLGSKKSAEKIVKSYKNTVEIKKSYEQVSFDRQTGKSQNRFYYLIRF